MYTLKMELSRGDFKICGIKDYFFPLLSFRYGFIPNGGRIYYERRSQPPFLTLMVESYYQATQDKEFLRWYLGRSWRPAWHVIILPPPPVLTSRILNIKTSARSRSLRCFVSLNRAKWESDALTFAMWYHGAWKVFWIQTCTVSEKPCRIWRRNTSSGCRTAPCPWRQMERSMSWTGSTWRPTCQGMSERD